MKLDSSPSTHKTGMAVSKMTLMLRVTSETERISSCRTSVRGVKISIDLFGFGFFSHLCQVGPARLFPRSEPTTGHMGGRP